MRAIWKDTVLAESDEPSWSRATIIFPPTRCAGSIFAPATITASAVEGHRKLLRRGWSVTQVNANAAWYYPAPKDAAREIRDHVAFWRGVEVVLTFVFFPG